MADEMPVTGSFTNRAARLSSRLSTWREAAPGVMLSLVARSEIGTYRQRLGEVLPLVVAVALLLAGVWIRLPILEYTGPSTQDDFNRFVVDRFAYSDIASLYFRDGLAVQPRPYFDYQLEYPVGTGLLIYLLNLAAPSSPYISYSPRWSCVSSGSRPRRL